MPSQLEREIRELLRRIETVQRGIWTDPELMKQLLVAVLKKSLGDLQQERRRQQRRLRELHDLDDEIEEE